MKEKSAIFAIGRMKIRPILQTEAMMKLSSLFPVQTHEGLAIRLYWAINGGNIRIETKPVLRPGPANCTRINTIPPAHTFLSPLMALAMNVSNRLQQSQITNLQVQFAKPPFHLPDFNSLDDDEES